MRTQKGRLPDRNELDRRIRTVGDPFSLYGVEAQVEGDLVRRNGKFILELTGTGERLSLGPLRRKVQWDRPAKKEQPATPAEKAAYKSLISGWDGKPQRVIATGPLVYAKDGKSYVMEVREFTRAGRGDSGGKIQAWIR